MIYIKAKCLVNSWLAKPRAWLIVFFLIIGLAINGKTQVLDSIFRYQDYIENIKRYHPLAKKADLMLSLAGAEQLAAKGILDPEVFANWNEKNFDDKLYYRHYKTQLKFNTRLGIDIIGAYENASGEYLNPQNKTDKNGLWQLGVEINVLQGLFINERRAALERAEIFQNLALNERRLILNELIYDATTAYLMWQQYAFFQEVWDENALLAANYLANTRQSFANGEKTAMDTLEAFISFQDAILAQQKNELQLIKSKQWVENFLWYADQAVEIRPYVKPESYLKNRAVEAIAYPKDSLDNHPQILNALNKLSRLEIEQSLKREKLKPKLKLKYYPLRSMTSNEENRPFSIEDFKWGVGFYMPLLLRSERAALQKSRIKIEEIQLELDHKRNELLNKINASWQQLLVYENRILLMSNNIDNYRKLLEGENEKFKYGESSVFLLNKRQEKYIQGQLKLIETYIQQQLELLNYLYYTNGLLAR